MSILGLIFFYKRFYYSELLGSAADSRYSELKIVDIPEDVDWYIEEYDGREWVAERHRTWE